MNETLFTTTLIIVEVVFSLMILRTIKKSGASNTVIFTLAVTFAVWLFVAYTMISNGFYSATGIPQVAFTAGVVIPVVIGLIAVKLWPALSIAVSRISVSEFLALQYMRAAFGIMFFFTASLPVWFQYLGGLGDIAAGIGAFLALQYFNKNPDKQRQANIRGNVVGVIDFIIVLNVGVAVVLDTHSPDMTFNLIPLYVVPLFLLLHVFSLQRLRSQPPSLAASNAA